jgi:hypothetical protein
MGKRGLRGRWGWLTLRHCGCRAGWRREIGHGEEGLAWQMGLVDIETLWLYLNVLILQVAKACKVVSGVRGEKRRSLERGAVGESEGGGEGEGERGREREKFVDNQGTRSSTSGRETRSFNMERGAGTHDQDPTVPEIPGAPRGLWVTSARARLQTGGCACPPPGGGGKRARVRETRSLTFETSRFYCSTQATP